MTEVTAYPLFNKADLASVVTATNPVTEFVAPPTLTLKEFARSLVHATGLLVDEGGPLRFEEQRHFRQALRARAARKSPRRNGTTAS